MVCGDEGLIMNCIKYIMNQKKRRWSKHSLRWLGCLCRTQEQDPWGKAT